MKVDFFYQPFLLWRTTGSKKYIIHTTLSSIYLNSFFRDNENQVENNTSNIIEKNYLIKSKLKVSLS